MKLAASYQNIELMTPDDAALSFFKSPFAVYDTCGTVDIAYGNFGSMACSPVDGEVVDTRQYLSEAVTTISALRYFMWEDWIKISFQRYFLTMNS